MRAPHLPSRPRPGLATTVPAILLALSLTACPEDTPSPAPDTAQTDAAADGGLDAAGDASPPDTEVDAETSIDTSAETLADTPAEVLSDLPSETANDEGPAPETVDDAAPEVVFDVPPDTPPVTGEAVLLGEQKQWHALTFEFVGPSHSETDNAPNPFLDYRFQMTFTAPSGAVFVAPGFFAGDGAGGAGDRWHTRFRADEPGIWTYVASFVSGTEVALETTADVGTPEAFDGASGTFLVNPTDKTAPDFRATGRIVYAGDHYLRTQSGALWIKGGTDSPENFLGYAGFDNTVDQPGGAGTDGLTDGLHQYGPHVADWQAGDPDWGDGAGRGIIGALNYLASQHVNSVYFLPCNLGGDGRETYPYVTPGDLTHIDLSKVDQWEIVLNHAQTLGIALHIVLNETEAGNENLHDGGTLGVQRKLFYREMVARFGHHPGLFWNIGEENDYSDADQIAFASYLRSQDPYDHPTTVHTNINKPAEQYDGLVGDPNFEMASLQLSPTNANDYTETWRAESAAAGRPWAVMLDEIGPAGTGVTDTNSAQIRQQTLWPAYLSGAAGVEWYFGYHALPLGGDMRCEDFRTREAMWEATWIARQFVEALPLPEMTPLDGLLSGAQGQVFAKAGEVYAVYLPNNGVANLDLSGESGSFGLRWYDVTTGAWSPTYGVEAPGVVSLGTPSFEGDVAAVVVAGETGPPPPDGTPGALAVTSVTLINADTDAPIAGFDPIAPNTTLDLAALPTTNLNLRANTTGDVGSVTFNLNGVMATESAAPYAFAGDTAGDYAAWTPTVGSYTLSVTPFAGAGGAGATGTPLSLGFDVVSGTTEPPDGCVYTTDNDMFIVEAEKLTGLGGNWQTGTEDAHTFIQWVGPQSTGVPGQGVLSFQIEVDAPGRYVLDLLVQVGNGTDPTEHNDTWFTFPGAADAYGMKVVSGGEHRRYPKPECENAAFISSVLTLPGVDEAECAEGATSQSWFKVYCSGALNWKWSAFTNDNNGFPVHVEFGSAGTYTVQLSARSSFHQIDRIVLRREDVAAGAAQNETLPETPCL